ncbi:MAG: DUF2306 domain-containing protein [Dokdonella sp.]
MTRPLEITQGQNERLGSTSPKDRRSTIRVDPANSDHLRKRGTSLAKAASSWFVVAVLGQWLFVTYVIGFYFRAIWNGQIETWNKVLPHGYVPGDTVGNLVVAVHLAFAVFIIVGGSLQVMTGIRRRFPRFHRINGRIYLASSFVMSVGGLIMVWTRGTVGGPAQAVAISINALLIMACAIMTVRHAMGRRFDVHRQWALRLFLVVSGVWFFRIGLMFWIAVNQGPVGFDPHTFRGPTLVVLAFGQYLVPLAILELYFHAQRSRSSIFRASMAASLFVLTLATAGGIVAAFLFMWLPRL